MIKGKRSNCEPWHRNTPKKPIQYSNETRAALLLSSSRLDLFELTSWLCPNCWNYPAPSPLTSWFSDTFSTGWKQSSTNSLILCVFNKAVEFIHDSSFVAITIDELEIYNLSPKISLNSSMHLSMFAPNNRPSMHAACIPKRSNSASNMVFLLYVVIE